MTARTGDYLEELKEFLDKNNLKYDFIIPDLPHGERILVNDMKNSGLKTAYAVNKYRDEALNIAFEIDSKL